MSLKSVLYWLDLISQDPSRNNKEKIIQSALESPDSDLFTKVIFYALDPYKMFNVTGIDKLNNLYIASHNELFDYLDYLSNKKGCTNEEKRTLASISSCDDETIEVVNRILKKDLKCGASTKTFKKFLPNLPEHQVMLCEKDIDKFCKLTEKNKEIIVSPKLDGVRTQAVVTKNSVIYLSRNGKLYNNFNKFDKILIDIVSELSKNIVIFDGEVISSDFQNLMKQTQRMESVNDKLLEFHIFDIVDDENTPWIERYDAISRFFKNSDSYVKTVPHKAILNNINNIYNELNNYVSLGYEGIILKTLNGPYEKKRSRHWTKVKKMLDKDLEVISIEKGTGKYKDLLGAIIVNNNGVNVKVGSGFSDEQRLEFINNPPIGQIVEVQYQEETKDGSLRFPVFKRIRWEK